MKSTEPTISPTGTLAELERLNRLYAMLSHINRTIVRSDDPQELYVAASRIAVEYGGLAAAWVCLLEPGSSRVFPVAAAGAATVAELRLVCDSPAEECPTAYAARTQSPFVVNDTLAEPERGRWQGISEAWGIRAGASFPIRLEGSIIGAFNVAANEVGFFRDAEINQLFEVTDDLSFALEGIRREEKHRAGESKLRYLAYYDAQTGMPSRILFEERMAEICREVDGQTVAVLVANLRHYHGIVQSLGSAAGQELIHTLAIRLESALSGVFVARVSESEFAVMLPAPAGLDVVEELAWQMHRLLAEAIQADDQELFVDPFVGIAVFPQDGEPADVLKHATQAASMTSLDSSSRCRFFFADMDDGWRHRLNLDSALRRALERQEFRLLYQPQVDLASGRIVGAEALLRWQRPDHGLVSPQVFIPLLEESGLIDAVGEWVLHEACNCTMRWQNDGLPPLRMAVNLSARQFHDGDVRALVRRALDVSRLDPQCLELELTEGIVLLNADAIIRTMHDLKGDGVTHALDDFGTGYSSLSYLQRLPVARIKIDRSFVIDITSNPSDAAIARAVVGMAHSLGLSVIAEGVETEGQLGYLSGLGCEEIQGYLFSHPLPEAEFADMLRDGKCIAPNRGNRRERVILLVDDEPGILSALTRVLRRQGYRILSTTSAREGFELLAVHRPGVIVCDQRMPEMTGTEFLRRVKELYPESMRIVLSGYTELNSVIDAVNQGAVYKFLTKPWEEEVLSDSIRDAFRMYELRAENAELSRQLQARQMASQG